MSSGFVSAGTTDDPIERDDLWVAAQKEIDASKLRKIEQARQSDTGKSLYETLEANKAAKQDAFEEANRLKNQFRALDEDEAEFLDSVLESTRAEEDRVKRETAEGLALFRQQQEEADKKARQGGDGSLVEAGSPTEREETWAAGARKRKRAKDKEAMKGVKVRRHATAEKAKRAEECLATTDNPDFKQATVSGSASETPSNSNSDARAPSKPQVSSAKKGSGLVDYGSDEGSD